ncbi:FIST signal transduction protein [Shumkonia mesophila]|uniref:FIST signal transduction protein n=1 Tax=Shumkonia mesophila TaxID=2838854 RepID=UPI002934D242|nr:FIST N-terminal domain-containing protein [Shumkonia mesophila]
MDSIDAAPPAAGSPVGLGQGIGPDSAVVCREAACQALVGLAPGDPPAWAVAFSGGRHDGPRAFAAMRDVLGDIPLVGGAAVGTITRHAVGYSGFECAVAVFPASLGAPAILAEAGLDDGEAAAGERLGRRIREAARPGAAVILFYDSVRSGPPPVLHAGSRLVEGIYAGLDGMAIHLVGGGTIADVQLTASYVFDGQGSTRHAAVAVILPPALTADTVILHGCVPASSFMEITRAEGAVVYELDGRPAIEALETMLGMPIDDKRARDLSLRVTLGEKHGDPFAPYDESAYVNRLIVAADAKSGALTLFEADFRTGARVQFMARDNDMMLASVKRGTKALMERLAGKSCVLGLYFDCAGRSGLVSGSSSEEAQDMVRLCRSDMPVLGFFSGVEIAPLMGRSRPLDWTGVLTVVHWTQG